ncbi:MAG: SDR family oxidoreductase [Spirochaetaceae bacterium]
MNLNSLEGERVLVTGGARRLGKRAAEVCADAGADIVIHYHSSDDDAAAAVEEISRKGVHALCRKADLSVEGEARELIDRLEGEKLLPTMVINSASLYRADTFSTASRKDLHAVADLTAYGPLELSRRFAERAESGSVINVLDARMVDYDAQHFSYHLAKLTLFHITRILAVELAPRFRVNGIAPGIILPPDGTAPKQLEKFRLGNPLEKTGTPEDFTRTLLFLAASPFITGEVVFVDGGRHLRGRMYGV